MLVKFNNLEGQSDEAVACKDCGVGKFNNLEGQANCCKDCGVGKFNNLGGQSDEAVACKDCGVGKFNNLEGQWDEAAACRNCGIGAFSNVGGATACIECPLNTLIRASVCCRQSVPKQRSMFGVPNNHSTARAALHAMVIVKASPA